MSVRDWRSLSPADVDPWYRAEELWWRESLAWETGPNWQLVEQARRAGTLPGFLAYDQGRATGWAFYLLHRGVLQIGALTAATVGATARLLDSMLATPEAARAHSAMVFLPSNDTWISGELAARGFAVKPFLYLVKRLPAGAGSASAAESFDAIRLTEVAGLLSQAYPGADNTRPFAPGGTLDEWFDYASQLISTTGCGVLMPDCCVLEEEVGRLDGAVLTTRLGPDTGHLAQVAVRPASQGRGLGRRLVSEALGRLRRHGCTRASLLVAADNLTAVGMYKSLGFEESGRFLSASRRQPTRSTIAACSTGGMRTFR